MHKDAAGAAAVGEAYVDLYVATPECRHHSARNHRSTRKKKAAELVKVRRSFRYISRARPRAVVVENVDGRGGGRGGHLELARANPGVSVGADGGLPVRELRRARAAATQLLGRQAPRLRGLLAS